MFNDAEFKGGIICGFYQKNSLALLVFVITSYN